MNNIQLGEKQPIADGVWGKKDVFVNYYFIKSGESDAWFLVDAGLKWSASRIRMTARKLFGAGSKPAGIILTHGHFDHVGALKALLSEWNVPVYAHEMEIPYLSGEASYPPADPTAGGGMMTTMSWMYPTGPIDIKENLRPIPISGRIPGLEEWLVIDTPGHSPGHISLFRERDKLLIAGDAIVTTQAESAIDALSYKEKLSGPPKYMTCNWASAKMSVMKIAGLNPNIVASGHGHPMEGEHLTNTLQQLLSKFDDVAVPKQGRYVNQPAVTNNRGVVYVPPALATTPSLAKILTVTAVCIAVGALAYWQVKKKKRLALLPIRVNGLR
ncbi:MBL fold metallo-hydrolase [Pseudochryseolinea flava]|uniref:MBL fold metallo-hydrolase n=1 Tax=Pseudochryseolinea flava TaxID=2059302 RepID=A0A364Y5T8_9BACT|nr:MBL fold metallo-hydrolase [Pseudochryseolinea flava]RAW02165.1 MBL fold metallo-hydrolase [Pseudochryseolinea flava]